MTFGKIGSPCPRCGAPGVLHRPCARLFCNSDDCEFSWKRHRCTVAPLIIEGLPPPAANAVDAIVIPLRKDVDSGRKRS